MKLRLILEAKLILVVDVIESKFAEVLILFNLLNHFRKSALTVNQHFKVEISLQSIFNVHLVTLTLSHNGFKLLIILKDASVVLLQEQCLLVNTCQELIKVFNQRLVLGNIDNYRPKSLFYLIVCQQN